MSSSNLYHINAYTSCVQDATLHTLDALELMAKPDFFIVGAPKCGTTALQTYLQLHPEVFMASKEMLYFGTDLFRLPHQQYGNLDAYLDFFRDGHSSKVVGESSVWYLRSERAAVEIYTFNPDAKIIAMFRNPIEMLPSLHSNLYYLALESLQTLEEALDAEETRTRSEIDSKQPPRHYLQYSQAIRYGEQLERYLEVFGHDRVLGIVFDEFRSDLPGTYRRVLEFLNIDTSFMPTFRPVNTNKEVRSRFFRDMIYAPPSWAQRIAFSVLSTPRSRRLVVDFLKRSNDLLNARHVKVTPPSQVVKERIRNLMRPEIERLGNCLKTDLSHWIEDERISDEI